MKGRDAADYPEDHQISKQELGVARQRNKQIKKINKRRPVPQTTTSTVQFKRLIIPRRQSVRFCNQKMEHSGAG